MDIAEPLAAQLALPPQDLVKLQTWFSPSFPVGAFAYSHGLEWEIETGTVRCARSLSVWIEGLLRHGSGRSDAVLLSGMWRAANAADWSAAREIADLAVALQPTQERRLESLSQGSAFLAAVAVAWPHPALASFDEAALPAAIGLAAALHGLSIGSVLVASLHAFAANLVSAGVRLVPLGQSEGLRVLAQLAPAILEVAVQAQDSSVDDVGSAGVLADIASMRHETQYSRLFRS